jgi:hypothetical protein
MVDARREQRRAPRAAIRLEAAYEDADRQVFLATRDLSEGGLYLLAADPPEVGVRARVLLELPGQPAILRLDGVVARCEPGLGFALCFDPDRVPSESRAALRDFARGEVTGCSA